MIKAKIVNPQDQIIKSKKENLHYNRFLNSISEKFKYFNKLNLNP